MKKCPKCNKELDDLDNGLGTNNLHLKCYTETILETVRRKQIDDLVDLRIEVIENAINAIALKNKFSLELDKLNLNPEEIKYLNESIENNGG